MNVRIAPVRLFFLRLALSLTLLPVAGRGEEPRWDTVSVGTIEVKSRDLPGSPVREYWAQTELDAEVQDLQATLTEANEFHRFMPFVKESRFLRRIDPDGSRYCYVRLELPPPLTARDYVVRVKTLKGVAPDGSGEFENRWEAVPDALPTRRHTVRLKLNEGSWRITPLPQGRSKVEYRFRVDPSGMVPPFAAEIASRNGIPDTLRAAEKEAQRRAALRRQARQTAERRLPPPLAPDAGTP